MSSPKLDDATNLPSGRGAVLPEPVVRATALPLPSEDDPAGVYRQRLSDRRAAVARLERFDSQIAAARGLLFFATVAAALAHYFELMTTVWPLGAFGGCFVLLVMAHGPVLDRLSLARRAAAYYERALERLADRWAGRGVSGDRYRDPLHLYADDLDLFGRGSLFELICQSRTRIGEDTLAAWLCKPPTAETIRMRQQAIAELRANVDLRERLAVLDAEVHEDLNQNRLRRWAQEPAQPLSPLERIAVVLSASLSVGTLVATTVSSRALVAFLAAITVEGIFSVSYGRKIRRLALTAETAASGLGILFQVLNVLEGEPFQSPLLRAIRDRLKTQGRSPAHQIARLQRLTSYLTNSLRNQFFAPLAFLIALPVHLVHAIERWRETVGPHIPDWLQAVGEFESLVSLAGLAFERPNDPFPQIVDDGPCFDARGLGHPLIPQPACVRNDLRLGNETRLILISGSNMSGKSTMLRTVGTNVVLAQARAVRAESLTLSVLQMGTAMRIRDSLQSGESLFYAAVSRLKSVVEAAGRNPPLLFLCDEILQGTNSHDRLIGSQGVLQALIQRGAIGLITTHDLALTKIADNLGTRAINVHFEDTLRDGKMTFDYRMRPGVVLKSNALELIRLMGLDV